METINDVVVIKSADFIDASQQTNTKDVEVPYYIPRHNFAHLAEFTEYNTWHKRCISLKAAVCTLLGVEIVTDDEDKTPDEEYRRLETFLETDNDVDGVFEDVAYRAAWDFFNTGNAYVEIAATLKNQIDKVFHAPAVEMRVSKDYFYQVEGTSEVKFTKWGRRRQDGKETYVKQMKNYDPLSRWYGSPEWLPAMMTMGVDRNQLSYNMSMFENEFMAKLILVIKGGKLSENAKKQLATFFAAKFKGVENAGRMCIIPVEDPNVEISDIKIQQDTKDVAFLNGRKLSRDEVISAHAVPPRLVGVMSAGQLGGGGEIGGQLKIFKETEIDPVRRRMERFWNSILKPGLSLNKWRITFKEMDITTALEDADWLAKVSPWMSEDEVREQIGLKPKETTGAEPKPEQEAEEMVKGLMTHLVAVRKALEVTDVDAE